MGRPAPAPPHPPSPSILAGGQPDHPAILKRLVFRHLLLPPPASPFRDSSASCTTPMEPPPSLPHQAPAGVRRRAGEPRCGELEAKQREHRFRSIGEEQFIAWRAPTLNSVRPAAREVLDERPEPGVEQ